MECVTVVCVTVVCVGVCSGDEGVESEGLVVGRVADAAVAGCAGRPCRRGRRQQGGRVCILRPLLDFKARESMEAWRDGRRNQKA